MSKSLEALKRLKEETQPNAYTLNHNEEDFKTIKQDLELKEQLEKENNELKDQLSYFKEESENWQSAYEWSQAKNSILKLKIQELEEVLKNEN